MSYFRFAWLNRADWPLHKWNFGLQDVGANGVAVGKHVGKRPVLLKYVGIPLKKLYSRYFEVFNPIFWSIAEAAC